MKNLETAFESLDTALLDHAVGGKMAPPTKDTFMTPQWDYGYPELSTYPRPKGTKIYYGGKYVPSAGPAFRGIRYLNDPGPGHYGSR